MFFLKQMKGLLVVAGLLLAVPSFSKTVTLYHTSDTHGFFFPRAGLGGAAALAAVLARESRPYLLLDGGDFAEGSVETARSKGLKAVRLMNRLDYDAATVGNHEFAFGEDGFATLAREARFPLLAANLTDSKTGAYPPNVLPYKIFTADGVKIAVIGLANAHPTRAVHSYTLGEPLPALKKALAEAEAAHPAVVVVLAHDSLADDRPGFANYIGDIGRVLGGRVHVVLGGHAHKTFENERRGGVLFAECGQNFENVSKITIETDDKTGKFVSAKSELIPLVISQTGEDPDMKAYADSLREPGVDQTVGRTRTAVSKQSSVPGHLDTPADNWAADATCRYVRADVCIHNTGGARLGLPQGDVTRRDLIHFYPFDNTVVTAEVSGGFLRRLVESGLVPWNRLAYSGLTVSFKKDAATGQPKKVKIRVNGKRLKKNKRYTVAVNSYVAGGGREGQLFKTLPPGALKPAGDKTMRQLLEDDLRRAPLCAPATGRIVLK